MLTTARRAQLGLGAVVLLFGWCIAVLGSRAAERQSAQPLQSPQSVRSEANNDWPGVEDALSRLDSGGRYNPVRGVER